MTHFDVAKLRQDLIEYQEDMASPGFWDNLERAQRVSAHAHQTESKIPVSYTHLDVYKRQNLYTGS